MDFCGFLVTQCLNALSQAALLFFLGVGLTLIFGIMRIVNFAHGAFFMLGAYVGYSSVAVIGNFWAALIVAPLLVGGFGAAFELGILRRLYRRDHSAFLMVTFGLTLIMGEAIRLLWGVNALRGPRTAGALRHRVHPRRAVPGLPPVPRRRRHRGGNRHLAVPGAHAPRPADPRHIAERRDGARARHRCAPGALGGVRHRLRAGRHRRRVRRSAGHRVARHGAERGDRHLRHRHHRRHGKFRSAR